MQKCGRNRQNGIVEISRYNSKAHIRMWLFLPYKVKKQSWEFVLNSLLFNRHKIPNYLTNNPWLIFCWCELVWIIFVDGDEAEAIFFKINFLDVER